MTNKKIPKNLLIVTALLVSASTAQAMSHSGAPMTKPDTAKAMPGAAAAGTAEGEIRKVDAANKKITLKHGEIKNLDMPPMSMVFQVKDPALLEKVKAGDKVRFKADKEGSAFVVTEIELVN